MGLKSALRVTQRANMKALRVQKSAEVQICGCAANSSGAVDFTISLAVFDPPSADRPAPGRRQRSGDALELWRIWEVRNAQLARRLLRTDAKFAALVASPRVHRFDAAPLVAAIEAQLSHSGVPLSQIHTLPEVGAWRGPDRVGGPNTVFNRRYRANDFYPAWLGLFHRFIADVVAPIVRRATGRASPLYFQREPTFRVIFPGEQAVGHPHRDSQYGHQAGELNVWVPLTRVWGSNTLWCESAPGRGDFAPFEVEPGELVLFWGNQLEHHTLPNKTDSTRVSFDARVLLADFYDGDLAAHSQAINGQRFEPGKYYEVCT